MTFSAIPRSSISSRSARPFQKGCASHPRTHPGRRPLRWRRLLRRQIVKPRHETPVDPVVPLPEQRAAQSQISALGHGGFAAQRNELEVRFLRLERPPPPAAQCRAQVVVKHRRRAHRKDTGLGPRRRRQMRAIPHGKKRRIVHHAQIRPDPDEPVVQQQIGLSQPVMRHGPGGTDTERRGHRRALLQMHLGLGDPRHFRIEL